MTNMETIAEIAEFLERENESYAGITIDFRPQAEQSEIPQKILDTYVTSLGYNPIGEHWESVSKSQVREILCQLLHRELAYSEEIISEETARHVATKFIANFDEDNYNVFSNARFRNNRLSDWFPFGTATFEAAIVIYDAHNIGIVYVDSED